MAKKDRLFNLIKALKQTEKRYFKVYASQHIQEGKNEYMKLFEALDKQEVYDELKIKKKFNSEPFVKRFPAVKNYLYHLLLRSLNAYHEKSNTLAEIRGLLNSAEILRQKALNEPALELIKKAKIIALKYEYFPEALSAINLERLVLMDDLNFDKLNETLNQENEIISLHQNYRDYYKLFYEVYSVHSRIIGPRSKSELLDLEKLMDSELAGNDDLINNSYSSKKMWYKTQAIYYRMMADSKKSHQATLDLYNIVSVAVKEGKESQEEGFASLLWMLMTVVETGDYESARQYNREIRKELNKIGSKNFTRIHVKGFMSSYSMEMKMYMEKGEFVEALDFVKEYESMFEQMKSKVGEDQIAFVHTILSVYYFVCGDYSVALKWNRKILEDLSLGIREDLHSFAKILTLLIHFEQGDTFLLEYNVTSTYRYLIKRKLLFSAEKVAIKFIRSLSGVKSKKDLTEAFIELRAKIETLSKNPTENRVLGNFDFISWLDSKIHNRSFIDMYKEKMQRQKIGDQKQTK